MTNLIRAAYVIEVPATTHPTVKDCPYPDYTYEDIMDNAVMSSVEWMALSTYFRRYFYGDYMERAIASENIIQVYIVLDSDEIDALRRYLSRVGASKINIQELIVKEDEQ